MLRNYFKVTLRSIRRDKGYAVTNVLGLAVGFACCILIALYVQHERSFDRFNENADRIYRIEYDMEATTGSSRWTFIPVAATPLLIDQVPEIERVVRVSRESESLVQRGDVSFYEDYFFKSEPSLFDVFDFAMLRGDPQDLARPNTIVISTSIAEKYFGSDDPIGETLSKTGKWSQVQTEYEVVGIMADPPAGAHFHPHFVASAVTDLTKDETEWRRIAYTYVLLAEGVDPRGLAERFEVLDARMAEQFNAKAVAALMPLLRIHLFDVGKSDIEPQGDIRYVWIFASIALLILVVACINYMNLATARASRRAREVGVRKSVGALRSQLVTQFIGEAVAQTLVALALGIGLAQLCLPAFNRLMEQPLVLELTAAWTPIALAIAAVAVGIVAGSYPALVLSRFRPSEVLKGSVGVRRESFLRRSLVVLQFAITAALIAGTILIQEQLSFVQKNNLGFDKDQVLVVSARNVLGADVEPFKQSLRQLPAVSDVSLASGVPGEGYGLTFVDPEEVEEYGGTSSESIVFDWVLTDVDYIRTLGLELVAGRNFSPERPTDASDAVIINETAVKALGWGDAVGRKIEKRTVVGVVRDFHLSSMKDVVKPMQLQLRDKAVYHVVVKLAATDIPAAIAGIEGVWKQFAPGQPMAYSFLDDDFAAMYRAESRLGSLFAAFAGLGIFVACLGLFGLSAYTAEQRTKEIGIRKVLGASIPGLIALLSRDLLKLVVFSVVIVAPVVYFGSQRWLQGFAYHVDVSWTLFVLSAVIAVTVALVTVGYQAIRVSLADPVNSLRYE